MFYEAPHAGDQPPPPPPPPPPGVNVTVGNNFFNPANVEIDAGQTVTWTNSQGLHTVTSNPGPANCNPPSSENFASPNLNVGDTFQHTFNTPGTYAYYCEIHVCSMEVTVMVT